jgi:UDP-N-acetyl-alpha-D-quinovosamine dehydrogenase
VSGRRLLLVTGASGFVGRAVVARALERGWSVRAVVRRDDAATRALLGGVDLVPLGDLTLAPDWGPALSGVDAVAHLAARVHVLRDSDSDPAAAFRRSNVGVTESLARAARARGTPRIVFVSTIKVNGERTIDRPFTSGDPPAPTDDYSRSKLEAELCLRAWADATGGGVVILRPPLVYGAGAGGNLARLLRLLDRGVPLPLAGVRNRRSLLGVRNLADAVLAGSSEQAPSGTYLVAEPCPISTPDLLRGLAKALSRRARLFWSPLALLRLAAELMGRAEELARLTESLEVDPALAVSSLGWHPAEPLAVGLADLVRGYRQDHPL